MMEITPLLPKNVDYGHKVSALATVSLFFKSVVGTGILALPPAIKAGGVVLGVLFVLLMCILTIYTMRIIILTVRHLRRQGVARHQDGRIEFMELLVMAFGQWGNVVGSFSVITCQVGSVLGFVCFIYSNMTAVCPVQAWQVAVVLFVILAPLCLLRTTDGMGWSSSLGNLALVLGLGTIYYYGFSEERLINTDNTVQGLHFWEWSGIAELFGVCLFMFSAHAEIISIEQNMKDRSLFLSLMTATLLCTCLLYIQFGVLVYMFFREETGMKWDGSSNKYVAGTLFDNIQTGIFVNLVKIFMCGAITFQFPIVILPAFLCVEQLFGMQSMVSYEHHPREHMAVSACRLGFLGLICGAGLVVPGFEFVVALTGAFSNGLVAFVLPPLFYWKLVGEELSMREKAFNWLVCTFGVLGCTYSTYVLF
eukprot:gb/GEZN01007536.1/.p1 GENE.gb/GEZN01007536.1/~~gb/GEZN01007536.1/.p1  ORF type:complete len:422 (-),score=61.28 gb/GEZN01007536.1/:238-1503(-)